MIRYKVIDVINAPSGNEIRLRKGIARSSYSEWTPGSKLSFAVIQRPFRFLINQTYKI